MSAMLSASPQVVSALRLTLPSPIPEANGLDPVAQGDAELWVVLEGRAWCTVGVVGGELGRGDALVMDRDPGPSLLPHDGAFGLSVVRLAFDRHLHGVSPSERHQLLGYRAFFEYESRLREQRGFEGKLTLQGRALGDVEELLMKLKVELEQRRPGFEYAAEGLFRTLSVQLARSYGASEEPLVEALVKLSPVLAWVDQHLQQPVTLEEMAAAGPMSQSTVQRCFRRCFGTSPLNYLLDLRMQKAQRLLRDTETKVKDIAPIVGIDDANYFTRRFRKYAGVEPTLYRARFRQNQPAPFEARAARNLSR